jgi:GT2 family glycosyltransferase
LISVVIPVRNGAPWLDEQLRALSEQNCTEPWEVVVADNGSTDGSLAVADAWSRRCSSIRWVDASEMRGAPAARNVGVRAAVGELLAFCDADDVVSPDWLQACAKALAEADAVAGFFDLWSLNGLAPSAPVPAATRQLGFLAAGLGANMAVRRAAFEDVGGFAEDLIVGEDVDLCWRLQLRGYRFSVVPAAIVAKRERRELREVFRRATAYGRSGPALYRRHRSAGARRDLAGAAKSWAWLLFSAPGLVEPARRTEWTRTAGVRIGRIIGSARHRVFFP